MEALKEQLSKGYGDLYVCTRDESAWSYGTMSLDDFHRLDSDEDALDGLANDMLEMLWDASRIDTVSQAEELPDDVRVITPRGAYMAPWTLDAEDLPAHVIDWGDSGE